MNKKKKLKYGPRLEFPPLQFLEGGGSIHIKPENKGKFTAYAKSKGKSVQQMASTVLANKDNYSPTIVKRANFARNAARWKKADGGTFGGSLEQSINTVLRSGQNVADPIDWGAELGFGLLDAITAPVTSAMGNSLSGMVGYNSGKGSAIGKGANAIADVAKPILSAIPITAPFALGADAIGKGLKGMLSFENGGNLGLTEYTGNTHEEGGIPIGDNIEVEDGETMMDGFVFSDNIQMPNSKKTFAQESKRIKSKYKLRPDDVLGQNSLRDELSQLSLTQETLKKEMASQKLNEAVNLDPSIMRMGGYLKPRVKMTLGSPPSTSAVVREEYVTPESLFDPKTELTFGNLDPIEPVTFQSMGPVTLQGREAMTNRAMVGTTTPEQSMREPSNSLVGITPPKSMRVPSNSGDLTLYSFNLPKKRYLGKAASMLGPLGNFAAAAFAPDGRLNPTVNFENINTRPAEVLAENEYNKALATTTNAIRGVAPTAGSFMSNVIQTASNLGAKSAGTTAGLRFEGTKANTEFNNEEAIRNQQIVASNNLIKDQSTANRWNLALKGVENLGQNLMTMDKDAAMQDMDMFTLGMLDTGNFYTDVYKGKLRLKGRRNFNKPLVVGTTRNNRGVTEVWDGTKWIIKT